MYFTLWCRESKLGEWHASAAKGWGCWGWKPVCDSRVRIGMHCSASLLPTSKDGQWHQHGTSSNGRSLGAAPERWQPASTNQSCFALQPLFPSPQPTELPEPTQAGLFWEPEFSTLPLTCAHWMGQRPPDAQWEFLLHKDVMHSAWSAHQQGDKECWAANRSSVGVSLPALNDKQVAANAAIEITVL